jgi:hypothetical protein
MDDQLAQWLLGGDLIKGDKILYSNIEVPFLNF